MKINFKFKKQVIVTYSGGHGSVLQSLWFSGGLLSGSQ